MNSKWVFYKEDIIPLCPRSMKQMLEEIINNVEKVNSGENWNRSLQILGQTTVFLKFQLVIICNDIILLFQLVLNSVLDAAKGSKGEK